jgi:diacylglycerol kinase family enzyme
MDLGRADGGCFLLMAGIGWDAEVTREVSPRLKKRVGDIAYIVQGALMAPRVRTRIVRWSADDATREGPLAVMVVSNTRLYGGRVRFTPEALANDGALDVAARFPRTVRDAARLAGKLALNRLSGDSCVYEGRVTAVEVETPGMAVQLDGDYAGETPMRFSVEPGALRVSLPEGELPPILRR